MNNDENTQIIIPTTMITKAQLSSVGINLPDDQAQALIQHVEETVNERISEEIVDSLDDAQVAELVALQDGDVPAEQLEAWIRERVPEYDEIVEDNVTIVLGELVENSEAIQAQYYMPSDKIAFLVRAILLCGENQAAVFLMTGVGGGDDKLVVLDSLLE